MRNLIAFAFACLSFATAVGAGSAADMMHGFMMMPACASGDPVVGVNTHTMMYMSRARMRSKMAGLSMGQQHAMMMKKHVKLMCKSKADAMGGKMMM